MLQKIQVRGGVKKLPHPSGGGGGVDFFWNNPFKQNFSFPPLLGTHKFYNIIINDNTPHGLLQQTTV